jgi:transcription initiation factor TFIIIB Brf1 subunit/transcription initiation factor TFIIB
MNLTEPGGPTTHFATGCKSPLVYRASDQVANEEYLAELEAAAERLDLGQEARSHAADLFLSALPDAERSKRATLATAVYCGALLAGEKRSQGAVADAMDVSRLTVQKRWKEMLETVGLEPPTW